MAENEQKYTIVTDAGQQLVVDEAEYRRVRGEGSLINGEIRQPAAVTNEADLFATNEAYIAAHGPAEPIRGRYMKAEQTHPGIARNAALGEAPDTFGIVAPGRTVPAEVPDPSANVSAEQIREAYLQANEDIEPSGEAVKTTPVEDSTPNTEEVKAETSTSTNTSTNTSTGANTKTSTGNKNS